MSSTYDFAEPGFVLIDRVNEMNNNWWCENIRATNPCGEQPLPPYGSCLLGSVNLTRFVVDPFTEHARFDWEEFRKVVRVFTRMLDNVVEINGLPLGQQRDEIMRKRRHGMGFLGLGSAITMLGMKYGSNKSVAFTQNVSREMAIAGWEAGLELAQGERPGADHARRVRGHRGDAAQASGDGARRLAGRAEDPGPHPAREVQPLHAARRRSRAGAGGRARRSGRALHASQLDRADRHDLAVAGEQCVQRHRAFVRASLFPQRDPRRQEVEGEDRRVLVRAAGLPRADQSARDARTRPTPAEKLPDYFTTADDITPREHVDIQAASQMWIDSSISKTANVPTDYNYEDFKDIYLYAYEQGLKGCTTFRFNPEAFQGVLVKEEDLKNTTYVFTLEDGTEMKVKGDEEIEYDGEMHTAANLFDALKEGYYGKF